MLSIFVPSKKSTPLDSAENKNSENKKTGTYKLINQGHYHVVDTRLDPQNHRFVIFAVGECIGMVVYARRKDKTGVTFAAHLDMVTDRESVELILKTHFKEFDPKEVNVRLFGSNGVKASEREKNARNIKQSIKNLKYILVEDNLGNMQNSIDGISLSFSVDVHDELATLRQEDIDFNNLHTVEEIDIKEKNLALLRWCFRYAMLPTLQDLVKEFEKKEAKFCAEEKRKASGSEYRYLMAVKERCIAEIPLPMFGILSATEFTQLNGTGIELLRKWNNTQFKITMYDQRLIDVVFPILNSLFKKWEAIIGNPQKEVRLVQCFALIVESFPLEMIINDFKMFTALFDDVLSTDFSCKKKVENSTAKNADEKVEPSFKFLI